ncbi:putative Cell morphogenesis protein [Helianthus annuus]|uniref:Cell morphogenesis protein n=1 Tax=Helianthus annuus TaxID=4232 RepID=A0A9K3DH60_HELAN|nr:putative Cell morphogenesis protein [Helianthus annuus]KAJ0813011.1 putative Cell morphogenesis protein [Helianthus annuus]
MLAYLEDFISKSTTFTLSISLNRFTSVTERFFNKLSTPRIDTSAARSETLSIINGMRYLKLG